MTAVATFSFGETTFLIADTLLYSDSSGGRGDRPRWLSTGVHIDLGQANVHEGVLKIWLLQGNLAVGYAGVVGPATALLSILADRITRQHFATSEEFLQFIQHRGMPSIGPLAESIDLCGFFSESLNQIKFRCSLGPADNFSAESTTQQKTNYAIGSGANILLGILDRIDFPDNETVDPQQLLSVVEEEVYKHQFLPTHGLVFTHFTGGAIIGVYSVNRSIRWSSGKTLIAFVNSGGTGLDAVFHWLPIIYKTWIDHGCLFSSAAFEQDGAWYQRLTMYTNALSKVVAFDKTTLPPEACTWRSPIISILLVPDYEASFTAVIWIQGGASPFQEDVLGGRMVGFGLNKDFFNSMEDTFFVRSDKTIALYRDAYRAKANWITERVERNDLAAPRVLDLLEQKAVALAKLGFEYKDRIALRDSLVTWLDAWDFCTTERVESLPDSIHNVKRFLADMRSRCDPDDLAVIQKAAEGRLTHFLMTAGP